MNNESLGDHFINRMSNGKLNSLSQINKDLIHYLDEGFIDPVDAITYAICINNAIELLKLKNDNTTK